VAHRIGHTVGDLHRGCLLASIAHAFGALEHPSVANEHGWDQGNYNVQDHQGSIGTVSFAPVGAFGGFVSAHSERGPLSGYLADLDPAVARLARDEALQYLLQRVDGRTEPVVTAIVWSDGSQLMSWDPWPEALRNGAQLIEKQLLPPANALERWRELFDLSESQAEIVAALYERRLGAGSTAIELTTGERAEIDRHPPAGRDRCLALLAEVGIVAGGDGGT
jgi:hypothetical protein